MRIQFVQPVLHVLHRHVSLCRHDSGLNGKVKNLILQFVKSLRCFVESGIIVFVLRNTLSQGFWRIQFFVSVNQSRNVFPALIRLKVIQCASRNQILIKLSPDGFVLNLTFGQDCCQRRTDNVPVKVCHVVFETCRRDTVCAFG